MDVSIQNCWWNSGGLWQDSDLVRAKTSQIQYKPQLISVAEAMSASIFTLRGPRRAGKTVALKLLIADLIESAKVNPRKILWYNLDTVRTLGQMETVLSELISKYEPQYIFLDEVTSVVGWQKLIKKFRDTGPLSKCSIFLTGSSAYDLKRGSERMAGRKGAAQNTDRVLLPMCYNDFKKSLNPHAVSVSDYLNVGGFPFRVAEYKRCLDQNMAFQQGYGLDVFDDIYFYEVARRRMDRNIALEVLYRVSQLKTSSISFESFAKVLTITNDTAKKYLYLLGDAFLLSTFNSYDTSRNRVAVKKDKKFHWSDPALAWLAYHSKQGEAPDEATLAEATVGTHILRQAEFRLFEGLSSPRNVFTWKSKAGNEIDFLIVDRSKKLMFPVEVKYQNSITDSDFMSMERAFKKGILVTKAFDKKREHSQAMGMEKFLGTDYITA